MTPEKKSMTQFHKNLQIFTFEALPADADGWASERQKHWQCGWLGLA